MNARSRAAVFLGVTLGAIFPLQSAETDAVAPARSPQGVPTRASAVASPQRALVDRYCVACHSEKLRTAGLVLERANLERVFESAETWEKVIRKLRSGAMPPGGLPRPDRVTSDSFVSWLETALDHAAAAKPNPGRGAVHRLNRAEYANAIRDLLAIEIDSHSLLPADDVEYGFDNIADLLSISPGLLERYLSASKKISRLAIGDPTIRAVVETYESPKHLAQDDRTSELLPLGSRGGMAILHHFPLDGEYVLKIRLRNARKGGGEQLELRLDSERIKLFAVDGTALEIRIPVKAGRRLVGVAFLRRPSVATEGLRPARLPVGSSSSGSYAAAAVGSVEIGGPYDVQGPGDSPSRRKVFVCRPTTPQDEEPCAKTVLATLARRAYRRPITDEDVQTLLGFYATRAKNGFEAGIQRALERVLVDPDFLFRVERDPANVAPATAYRLSDLELASRLSFFLWGSIPDDQLISLAERSALKDPVVLEQQVRRMLADDRSIALVSSFAAQWLHLRNMRAVAPDVYTFPEFDDNLREGFQRETELFLENQLRDDRSVLELLSADYTFVNERLARHYGIPNIRGPHFRRVSFSDGTRGGLLGQGSILTVTSYAHRTSPVLRGKWLLENILGAPPPPPPPNVPDLPNRGEKEGAPRSVREQMEEHRRNPVCASCHARMDPLGFALENFDAIGRWRTTDAGVPIDSSGILPDGTKFSGPTELRNVLVSRRKEFVVTFTEKLLTYALGRGIEYYDAPAVRQIMREAAPTDYRWSSIILGIVKSVPFQMRRSEP